MQTITENKRAYFDYEILKSYEVGLKLSGSEVKAIKKGNIDLKGSYVIINRQQEPYLVNSYIAPYPPAALHQKGYDPHKSRKLLLKKKEIKYLTIKSKEKGLSLIPLRVYLKKRLIKIEIGLGRGKKKIDKRELIKKREFERRKRKMMRR